MSLGRLQALEEFYNTQIIISVWQTKNPFSLHSRCAIFNVTRTITWKVDLGMIQ